MLECNGRLLKRWNDRNFYRKKRGLPLTPKPKLKPTVFSNRPGEGCPCELCRGRAAKSRAIRARNAKAKAGKMDTLDLKALAHWPANWGAR
jgi:hypothetical protein